MNQYDKIRKSDLTEPTAIVRAPQDDLEDTEGHKRGDITDAGDAEDTEGHKRGDITDAGDAEDTEGHRRSD